MAPPPFLPPPHGPWGRGEGGEKSFLGAERGAFGAKAPRETNCVSPKSMETTPTDILLQPVTDGSSNPYPGHFGGERGLPSTSMNWTPSRFANQNVVPRLGVGSEAEGP